MGKKHAKEVVRTWVEPNNFIPIARREKISLWARGGVVF
jgi:hypothetical protein